LEKFSGDYSPGLPLKGRGGEKREDGRGKEGIREQMGRRVVVWIGKERKGRN
jgi:hypothetical protein